MRGLREKVAIVTGAASARGIGFATGTRLAEEGVRLVLTDIDHAAVAERAGELRGAGYSALGLAHDAMKEDAWEDVLAATKAEYGRLDILVNNAAICTLSPIIDMPLEDWRRQIDTNGVMTFLGCRTAAREMQASGRGGAIVNVASVASLVAGESGGAYCASKGAVHMLTKVLAIETAKHGIRVNSVHPGYTNTQMLGDEDIDLETTYAAILEKTPAGRFGKPSDIAAAIAFLASDDAAFCIGTSLVVDGGQTA